MYIKLKFKGFRYQFTVSRTKKREIFISKTLLFNSRGASSKESESEVALGYKVTADDDSESVKNSVCHG